MEPMKNDINNKQWGDISKIDGTLMGKMLFNT